MWQLWAARVDYPRFGLTSVLDAEVAPPPGIEATVAGLDPTLRRAALALAGLLRDLGVASRFGPCGEPAAARALRAVRWRAARRRARSCERRSTKERRRARTDRVTRRAPQPDGRGP